MRDNDLIRLFLPIISAGLTALGYSNITVKQAYQPTQQGVNSTPTVYYYKISDKRYGFLKRIDNWDAINQVNVHTETQQYETTFQINSLVIQDPAITNSYTAADLVNSVAAIMQSSTTIQILKSQGVGILRVTDVRNPYAIDDKGRYEANPSFDFTLTHKQIITSISPVNTTIRGGIYRV